MMILKNTKATREIEKQARSKKGWFAPAEECAARKRVPLCWHISDAQIRVRVAVALSVRYL